MLNESLRLSVTLYFDHGGKVHKEIVNDRLCVLCVLVGNIIHGGFLEIRLLIIPCPYFAGCYFTSYFAKQRFLMVKEKILVIGASGQIGVELTLGPS